MDWCSFFGFRFDPFFDKPLESTNEMEKWLIVEKKMEEEVTPLIRQMKRVPFLSLVVGDRGVGKSTFLYYSMKLATEASFLPVYVGIDHSGIEFSTRPTFEMTETLMHGLGAKLLDATLAFQPNFFSNHKSLLMNLGRYLGLSYDESEGFLPSGKPYRIDFFELKRYTLAILKTMKQENLPVLLAIDNLDKVSKIDILKRFFTTPFAQTFYDDIKKGGVSILLAMAPSFSTIKKRHRDLKYLTQEISISPISPSQTVELLTKRIIHSNDPPPRCPFDREAMISLGIMKKGITRDILTEARNLCLKAYNRKMHDISREFVEEGLTTFNESRTLYEILDRNEDLRKTVVNLCKLATDPRIDFKDVVSAIGQIIDGKGITVSDDLLASLINMDIIRSGVRKKYLLSASVDDLVEAVRKSGWDINQFFEYVSLKDSIRVIAEGIPGVDAQSSINKFGPIPEILKPSVQVAVGGTLMTIQTRQIHQDASSQLKEAKNILDHIGQQTWDEIDNVTTYKKIYTAIKAFLSAFCRFYISCATSRKVRIRSWKASDFIENCIYHFQEEFGTSFKSFYRYQRLKANMNGLLRGGFSPSHSHVKDAFLDLKEVVTEFTNEWQLISNKFSRIEVTDEQHHFILGEVSRVALVMGFSIERPEYARFRIDGQRYYELGYSEHTLDEASVDLVKEKRLRNRFGEIQSHFLVCCVKPNSKLKATDKEILAFLHKCNDLVDLIDKESSGMPEGWPRYLLIYISASGFESGIGAAIRSTTKPPRSQLHVLDYGKLQQLKHRIIPRKRLPQDIQSEKDLIDSWENDLEEVLRVRLHTYRLVREEFKKTTTILIADMKGFTERTRRDDLEAAEAVQKMSDILKRHVRTYGGSGTNTEGDSFVATFAKPDLAMLAALKSIEEIKDYNRQVEKKQSDPCPSRNMYQKSDLQGR